MACSNPQSMGHAETAEDMWKVCPVCGKRYPGPLGHACTGGKR